VLVAHNVASLAKNLPLTAALHTLTQRPGAPALVLWHHDLAWTTPRYRAELHDGYPWDLLRTDWPWAMQIVVSQLRRDELGALLGVPADRIHVVPNGVDLNVFYKLEAESARLVARLGLLDARPLLLLPVRLTPRKNVELALDTLAALRQGAFPQAQLLVTGPQGPHNPANAAYFARLQAQRQALGLESAAHFLAEQVEGVLPDAVIADFYRLADALLFPSREEGFGIPMLEAALSRMPVFCADIPPLRALGEDDAIYFAPDASGGSVAALIEAHLSALPTFRFAARARSYTWAQIAAHWLIPLLEQAAGTRAAVAQSSS
jgi:mannosylglucosylglycerate synthase